VDLKFPLIKPGNDLVARILSAAKVGGLRNGDVLVLASKIVATANGTQTPLGVENR
jgi:F420-0:gamma-glutamyl ligase